MAWLRCAALQGLEGPRLVGHRVRVWWPMDRAYYRGTIAAHTPQRTRPYSVTYDDGDTEVRPQAPGVCEGKGGGGHVPP